MDPPTSEDYLLLARRGWSLREIAKLYTDNGHPVSYVTVGNRIKEIDGSILAPSAAPVEEYLEMYEAGQTLREIGKAFGVSGQSVHKAIARKYPHYAFRPTGNAPKPIHEVKDSSWKKRRLRREGDEVP